MITVSNSRIGCYLSCPYAHYLRYVEKLVKKTKSRSLNFGSDFHKLLEHRIEPEKLPGIYEEIKEKYYDLGPSDQAELGDDYLESLSTIFSDYQEVYKEEALPKHTEIRFEIPIGKYKGEKVFFVGIIDEIYEDGMIGEHKTFNRKPDVRTIVMNTQKCLYAKAVEIWTGKMPERVQWDYIKNTPAPEPIWLEKSQKFSESKSDKITPFSWMRACKSKNLDLSQNTQKAEAYQGNIPNYFFRLREDYIPEMVNEIYSSFLYSAKEAVRNAESNKSRHTGQNCSWCEFKDICYAELTGGNAAYIREKDFKERSEW